MRHALRGARCVWTGFRRDAVRRCSGGIDAVILSARLPAPSASAPETVDAVQRLLAETSGAAQVPEVVWRDPRASELLAGLGDRCADLDAQQMRTLLAAFAGSSHMPPLLWGRLAEELPRALTELPDLHAVHVALLMASMDLRHPHDLLLELADQLDLRVTSLSPQGLAAAVIALSQLGPWPHFGTGRVLADELLQHMDKLPLNQLSASALAVATLGIVDLAFWQMAHGHLNSNVSAMTSRHLADVLMALATTQNRPISLLEALQDRLKAVATDAEPEEALSCAWALVALKVYPATVLGELLQKVVAIDSSDLSNEQSNQIRQVAISLELETAVKKACDSLPGELLTALQSGYAIGDTACADDDETLQEICDALSDQGSDFSLASTIAEFYIVDISLKTAGGTKHGLVLDGVSSHSARAPHDPWTTLKLRHLPLLGCPATWLPSRRWKSWDDEERQTFIKELIQGDDGQVS